MIVEIRCCCVPKKLLGWVDLPEDLVRRGHTVRFAIMQETEVLELPLRTVWPWGHLALASEETPIEKLRGIRGFCENK